MWIKRLFGVKIILATKVCESCMVGQSHQYGLTEYNEKKNVYKYWGACVSGKITSQNNLNLLCFSVILNACQAGKDPIADSNSKEQLYCWMAKQYKTILLNDKLNTQRDTQGNSWHKLTRHTEHGHMTFTLKQEVGVEEWQTRGSEGTWGRERKRADVMGWGNR